MPPEMQDAVRASIPNVYITGPVPSECANRVHPTEMLFPKRPVLLLYHSAYYNRPMTDYATL